MDWLTLLGAFGIGSVITTIVQAYFNSKSADRTRNYNERKEAYIGLLEAWVRQEKHDFNPETFLDVGHWTLRVELVASQKVFEKVREWADSVPGSDQRIEITKALKAAMRDDLRK